ncbi:Rho GTPase-activating protein 8 [Mycena venus]|uniref:Rho GTPase-activating protein 8 n=1 Tax=Mycena venus TaxID=2733690 RepID=A0A8H6YUR9_9AGAR|nr:Rho GTPase-activating protein 8 [Mycena venus]
MAPGVKAGTTLKQRLAALSLAQSSPASGPPSPSSFKRKFTAPWARKQSVDDYGTQSDRDNVEEVMARFIFQAGVDFETRPMVVVNASALPDPKEVNYDLLLSRILDYLNLYVESDYTVVFFAAGGKHTPGWNWVWKAYRSLNRKYRKNLKRLYIVHSSFFSKMLFSLAGAIISPKFFRKLTYIPTLSELACHIPLTQIDVPPAAGENLKYESKIMMPVTTRGSDAHGIFGVPLEDLMGFDGEKGGIPRVVRDAIQFIRESGMEEEGLFRRSPQSVMLKAAQDAYDRGNVVSLDTFGDPHLAAVLLKKYLRDLPEPLIPESLYPVVRRCPMPSPSSADPTDPATVERDLASIAYIRDVLLPQLPLCVYILLSHVLHLMHDVSLRAASNRMDAHNLAVVLCPNLVASKTNPARDVMMCAVPGGPALFTPRSAPSNPASPASNASASSNGNAAEGKTTLGTVVKLCIQRYFEVFDEVHDRTEALSPPRALGESSESSSTSSTSGGDARRFSVRSQNEDEDIDDEMLVMPIGMASPTGPPPSAWGAAANTSAGTSTWRARHRSMGSGAASTMTGNGGGARSVLSNGGGAYGSTAGRTRSLVSVEKGSAAAGTGTVGRKGSIAVGRGTTRKASGAAVEAVGITASGFFSAPISSPGEEPTRVVTRCASGHCACGFVIISLCFFACIVRYILYTLVGCGGA